MSVKKSARTLMLFLVMGLLFVSGTGVSQGESLTGDAILASLEISSALTGSGTAQINMITENAQGAQRSYGLKLFRDTEGEADKQLLEYLAPADIRGTKFLSINEPGQEGQMWLYLPSLGRERRIAAHMTQDKFMGTDFTYEEIGGELNYQDEYTALRLADERMGEFDCYVLNLTSQVANANYPGIKMWVWQQELMPVRIEFYDSAANLQKILTLGDFRQVDGQLIPHHLVMADNLSRTRTIIEITEMSSQRISEDLFTVRYLRR